jgi:hypothetical protein
MIVLNSTFNATRNHHRASLPTNFIHTNDLLMKMIDYNFCFNANGMFVSFNEFTKFFL